MKKIILCGFIVVVLMLAACQAPGAASSTDIVSGNDTAAESPTQELSAEETIRRFFECFNNRDAEGINALMETGLRMTLTEEESAVLKLISCTELQTDGEASVVEAVFDVKLDDRHMSSFEEGKYTWRFELDKGSDGVWRIANYGV